MLPSVNLDAFAKVASAVSEGSMGWLKKLAASALLLILVIGALVIFVALTIILAATGSTKAKDWIQLGALFMASISGGVSYVGSYFSRLALVRDNQELTELKGRLDAKLAEITARLEQATTLEYEAYGALWKAATKYYIALNRFDRGKYDESALNDGELALEESLIYVVHVREADQQTFFDYRQAATYLGGKAVQIRSDAQALKRLWQNESGQVFDAYDKVRSEFSKRLHAVKASR